jgi:hypothetical protein
VLFVVRGGGGVESSMVDEFLGFDCFRVVLLLKNSSKVFTWSPKFACLIYFVL